MVRNKIKYDQAISLRQRGFTFTEIAKICEISKSTASEWFKDQPFSERITILNKKRAGQENAKRLGLIAKTRTTERKQRYKDAEQSAKVEFANYQKDPLFMAGLTAYLSAGDQKDPRVIRLSHRSEDIHRLFIKFAIKYLGVEKTKIHLWLLLYGASSEEKVMRSWSKKTTIPYSQFYKNQYVNKTTKQTLHKGVGNTIIGSTYHKQKLICWTKLAKGLW
jgi:transcriptional regulator with XRE-family HTH domain